LFLIKRTCELYGWIITEEGELGKEAKLVIKIPGNSFNCEDL